MAQLLVMVLDNPALLNQVLDALLIILTLVGGLLLLFHRGVGM